MRPTALLPSTSLRVISGVLFVATLGLLPSNTFAQRAGAGARGGATRPNVVRAPEAPATRTPQPPVFHPSAGAASRPTGINPFITRPAVIGPAGIGLTGVGSAAQLGRPLVPTGIGLRPGPLRFPTLQTRPIYPVVGVGLYGLGGFYGPGYGGLFPFCGGIAVGYGCPMVPTNVYGYPYPPQVLYPQQGSYPAPTAQPTYQPDEEPSQSLQYAPMTGDYSSLDRLQAQNLTQSLTGTAASGKLPSDIVLYFKDGSVFAIATYTVSHGTLHYVTAYGEEGDIAVELLDVPKTIHANAAWGVTFTLTPPANSSPGGVAPGPAIPAPAQPGPIHPPKT